MKYTRKAHSFSAKVLWAIGRRAADEKVLKAQNFDVVSATFLVDFVP
jgi:hypothetical protein